MNTKQYLLIPSLGLLLLTLIWTLSAPFGPVRAIVDTAVTPTPDSERSGVSRSREVDPVSGYVIDGQSQPQIEPAPNPVSPNPQAIANGDFESGPDGSWREHYDHDWDIISRGRNWPLSPHSGIWGAWLGGDYDDTSFISQKVTIPAGLSTLSYWTWIFSKDSCGFDFAEVLINDTIVQVIELCAANNTGRWVRRNVNLSAYARKRVTIQIRVETDDMFNSNFFVDDVTLMESSAYLPVTLNNFATDE